MFVRRGRSLWNFTKFALPLRPLLFFFFISWQGLFSVLFFVQVFLFRSVVSSSVNPGEAAVL